MRESKCLNQAREAFQRQVWSGAYTLFIEADQQGVLTPDDLERLAVAACLLGKDEVSDSVWTRAHQEFLDIGDAARAARCAFWLATGLQNRGEHARASGWFARASRLLGDDLNDCVEQGYLLLPSAYQYLDSGDIERAHETFRLAGEAAERFSDPDLMALALHSRGRCLIRLGDIGAGLALLDEAMVAVEATALSPLVIGDVYCSVIEGCQEAFDLRRAIEWTQALAQWCESQPDLVPYRGKCLIRRAEILQLHGAWPEAVHEAGRACERLSGQPLVGLAHYRQADLFRLLGQYEHAEQAYREASRWVRTLQPGLAQLRLAQGRASVAEVAIRRALEEARGVLSRARLLPAYVEVMLAVDDVRSAREATDEFSEIAIRVESPQLRAAAAHALGGVLLCEGDARSALDVLRDAWALWQELDVPYEAARTRVLIGLACRTLDDHTAAEMEFEAARWVFEQLGAAPDLSWVESLDQRSARRGRAVAGGLTAREHEVLRLLANGETNKKIAAELAISERTVERHVSNIFDKLGVSSRAAATAFAYRHELL